MKVDTGLQHECDALGRRIQETIQDGNAWYPGMIEGSTRDFYHSASWQVLEERTRDDDEPEYEAQPAAQYVWGPQYVDQLILIDREVDGNPLTPLEDRLYVQQDANFNVTSVTNENGTLLERYEYDPYGQRLILEADWSADANQLSDVGMLYGFQGGRHTDATASVHFRNRDLNVVLGRWNRQDPMGYVDGANRYQAMSSATTNELDPFGLLSYSYDQCRTQDDFGNPIVKIHRYKKTWSWFGRVVEYDGTATIKLPEGDDAKMTAKYLSTMTAAGEYAQAGMGAVLLVGSVALPGPEDAVVGLALSRYGLKLVGGAIVKGGKKLTGAALKEATAQVAELAAKYGARALPKSYQTWKALAKGLREGTVKNVNVGCRDDAERLVREAFPDYRQGATYAKEKGTWEWHPEESKVGNDFPHIKFYPADGKHGGHIWVIPDDVIKPN